MDTIHAWLIALNVIVIVSIMVLSSSIKAVLKLKHPKLQ